MLRLTSFRARIFWSLVPIFFALFVLLGVVDLYQQGQLAEEEVAKRAQSMAENLAYSSRLAVLTEDKSLLNAALQSVTGVADFAYVSIYGERWTPLINAKRKQIESGLIESELTEEYRNKLSQSTESLIKTYTRGTERYVEFMAPITSIQSSLPYELQIASGDQTIAESTKEPQTIGAVRLALSMTRVDAQRASFLKWRGSSLVVFLCLSTIVIYIFSVKITRPINRLTEQAKRMSRGYLNEEIPADSGDEIGQLATAFNEMARALNNQYLVLERKVAERTKELTKVNEKLAETSEHKSRFLANVNHELRTPLSSIIGYARLMQRETEGQISSLQRENLEDLLGNAERLLGMIDSLLDLAKIEAGKMDVNVGLVRIDELIQGAASSIEPMLNKQYVSFIRDIPPNMAPLYSDPEKLRQIVLNLLENAVKFTDFGEIKISVSQANGNFKLAVADSGIGVAQADLKNIFEEFERGRITHDGNYRGTGLGLAIVKRLVDVLGGSVVVDSAVGRGSTFTVTLPVNLDKTGPV